MKVPSSIHTRLLTWEEGGILGKEARIKSHMYQPIRSELFYPQCRLKQEGVSTLSSTTEPGYRVPEN